MTEEGLILPGPGWSFKSWRCFLRWLSHTVL